MTVETPWNVALGIVYSRVCLQVGVNAIKYALATATSTGRAQIHPTV